MKNGVICSAGSKEDLEKMINEYYFSKNYIITDDNKIFNTKLNKYLDNKEVVFQRKRWKFKNI